MKAIVAVDKNWGIGKNNDLLFSIPLDMAFFREQTKGKVVVMGSKTLKSFPNSKPLKNRTNIVFHRGNEVYEGCIVVKDLTELGKALESYNNDDVFVIGGGSIYNLLLEYCSEALITKVDADGDATIFFENLDNNKDWVCIKEDAILESNGYKFKFTTYKNKNVKTLK
ncbi:MAG: dihydrofolate reductase [Clostridiales bacterium]|nr:dihydrofolate reductase [Clostridiales bacterium]